MSDATTANDRASSLPAKNSYDELSERQQAVVDAIVDDPDATSQQIADRVGDVSPGYVRSIWSVYSHIIADRKAGNRADVLGQISEDSAADWQYFDDRPVKHPGSDDALAVELDRADVEAILRGEMPEGLRADVLARVVERAFETNGG